MFCLLNGLFNEFKCLFIPIIFTQSQRKLPGVSAAQRSHLVSLVLSAFSLVTPCKHDNDVAHSVESA